MGISQFDIPGIHAYRRITLPTKKTRSVDLPRTRPKVAIKEAITRAKERVNGNGNGNGNGGVLDVMQTLGIKGLWNVYVAGGAYGSKEATKTLFEEYWKAKEYDISDLEKLWGMKEWKDWQPETTIPVIPSIQIDPMTVTWPKLPSLDDLKTPLIIAGVALGGLFLLGKFIGRKS